MRLLSAMDVSDNIFSIRLVVADFYMEKPVHGFDPVYSEFRGKEIKKIPIIRVFGSNAQGQKTCMHIHGVFPYFYVPYDQKDFESVNKAIYQVAINLDKAINISLSQGSSDVHHVFRIQLVKGIPFYGYHRAEHQFLKIYMFNPRFVRRAANLLQNGAIMNKNFHPYEAHVPYILQFMIDYNLYGMSFIHVPLEIVKFRRSDISEQIPFKNIQAPQILDHNVVKKISCCSLEVDISSNFILNRFQLAAKDNTKHTNPGIESIWNDEMLRRQKIAQALDDTDGNIRTIPPLEVPTTQERPNVYPTESEVFYRTALVNKLQAMETALNESSQISDQSINSTLHTNVLHATLSKNCDATHRNQKRTFNLTKILQNSVYPEECTQTENLINASHVENHLSKNNIFEQCVQMHMCLDVSRGNTNIIDDSNIFLDDTIVDEELITNLTQSQQQAHVPLNATLREEDLELLEILQQLEEDNNNCKIDIDSSLAPLSQTKKDHVLSPDTLDRSAATLTTSSFNDDNGEEDNEHDFSIALENVDDMILKLTQSQKNNNESSKSGSNQLAQIDGSDDLLRTPTKTSRSICANATSACTPKTKSRRLLQPSPPRTPKTPKSINTYKPLPLIITNRSAGKKNVDGASANAISIKSPARERDARLDILRKKVTLKELRRKNASIETEILRIPNESNESKRMAVGRRRSKHRDLDKTHITCSLTPRRTNEKMLKVYNVDDHQEVHDVCESTSTVRVNNEQEDKNNINLDTYQEGYDELIMESEEESTLPLRKTPNLRRLRCNISSSRCKKKYDGDSGHNSDGYDPNLGWTVAPFSVEQMNSDTKTSEEVRANIFDNLNTFKQQRAKLESSELQKVFVSGETPEIEKLYAASQSSQILESLSEDSDKNLNTKEIQLASTILRSGKRIEAECLQSISRTVNFSQSEEVKEIMNNKPWKNKSIRNFNFTKKTMKNVCVKIKKLQNKKVDEFKIKTVTDSAINVSDPTSTVLNGNYQDSGLIKSKPHCRDKNKNEIMGINLPTSSSSENLLKSLMKLNGTIKVNMTANLKSADITSASPTKGNTSHLSQGSPAMLHKVEDEIGVTSTSYEDCMSSNSYKSCVKSVLLHSPSLFTQISSPSTMSPNDINLDLKRDSQECDTISLSASSSTNENHLKGMIRSDSTLILSPLDEAPTREEVLKGCIKLRLPKHEYKQPFYSNPNDLTRGKEVSFTILQIQGNKINDIEEFQSILGSDVNGLVKWRRNHLLRLAGPEILNKCRNTQRIREYIADRKVVTITPHISAPTRHDVKVWLKARELVRNKGEGNDDGDARRGLIDEDSPIKVRRQKVTMMLSNEGDESADDCDCSLKSLTLTRMTPLNESVNTRCSPVTTKITNISLERNGRRILKRVSLNAKMEKALTTENNISVASNHNTKECIITHDSEERVVPNSQTSETSSVTSQTALKEMDRFSFLQTILHQNISTTFDSNNSTLNNTFGFKVALENLQQAKADVEFNYLTIITLEVFVCTRDDLFPNPQIDEIRCIFYAIEDSIPNDENLPRTCCGYITVHDPTRDIESNKETTNGIDRDIDATIVRTEVEALEALLDLCSRWDPDIYAGYEIEMSSWGFIIERAKYLCLNIAPLLSRVPSQKGRDFVDEDREQFTDLDVEMKLCGRILLDVWRLMRSEIALTSYTFENVMYHIMHRRCPWHSYRTLTRWFSSPCSRWIVMQYYLERVRGTLALLDQLDLIGRTSEMAKLMGIQFYEVLSRGSQFRVESMMLRIAKPKNIVPLSPSVQQRAHMRAPEYLPLILEPKSRFYADPLIVLDFQSLYPSMIIGYNYCFSTCLGRVEHLGQSTPFEFGASQLRVSPTMLRKLVDRDLITISPCGVVFVKTSVREGILPRMLTEILDTRQMIKQSMKIHKSNSALQRILHSRQLGLKLMANTTYGYTAANFSGRMPAVEVGDTVVAKGRETLERAIKMVEANEKWNVKVVYGDTDSLFVLVPGRDRQEAFRIGEEIAEAVTKQNPPPVKLKLEKVYQPCILQTKKRYVGYMYETPDQKEPIYEAKGIETVRRDGCPIVAKMLEKVLRILFESADVSQVKHYVCRQFTKLLSGRGNLQDLIFAKEFRGIHGYKANACVPALELTRKWIQTDPRRIPRRGERVPFIVTNGPPGVPLIRLIHHPHEVLNDEGLKINAIYYITKAIIPPLNRCLLLLGADVNEWFANLPRKVFMTPALSIASEVITPCPNVRSKKSTISQFFSITNCVTDCGRHTKHGICSDCTRIPLRSVVTIQMKSSKIERDYLSTQQICQSCCGRVGDLNCESLDCPVLFVLEGKRRDLQQIAYFRHLLEDTF